MSTPRVIDECATDFVAAAGLVRAGSAEAAMVRLLPSHLTEHALLLRVHLMVAAGVAATTALDPAAVQVLLTADHAEPVDLLVALVGLFAQLDRSREGGGDAVSGPLDGLTDTPLSGPVTS